MFQVALDILKRACSNYPEKLLVQIDGSWSLEYMIPTFIVLSEHPNAKMRAHAIACLSNFVRIGCNSLFERIDAFIACLFERASDEDPAVREHVCRALGVLIASRPEKLMPEMVNVAEYMLYFTKDKHKNVALEACDFWITFAETPDLTPNLRPLLTKVTPALLDCMVYSEDDMLRKECHDEDPAVRDKNTDIRRRLWSLRQYAEAALDALAVRFGADLLNVVLEPLKMKLWSEDWLQCESGIFALGAIAPGRNQSY